MMQKNINNMPTRYHVVVKAKKGLQNIIAHDEFILLMDIEQIEVKYDNGYLGVTGGQRFYSFFFIHFSFFLNLLV